MFLYYISFFFFFNDTATTEIYTLSLHDALPIYPIDRHERAGRHCDSRAGGILGVDGHGRSSEAGGGPEKRKGHMRDRKSTRLNSSHGYISYAVFCLKKKKNKQDNASDDERTSEN